MGTFIFILERVKKTKTTLRRDGRYSGRYSNWAFFNKIEIISPIRTWRYINFNYKCKWFTTSCFSYYEFWQLHFVRDNYLKLINYIEAWLWYSLPIPYNNGQIVRSRVFFLCLTPVCRKGGKFLDQLSCCRLEKKTARQRQFVSSPGNTGMTVLTTRFICWPSLAFCVKNKRKRERQRPC